MTDRTELRKQPDRQPFNARCGNAACGHVWPVAYLPMAMNYVAELGAAARCPMCASRTASGHKAQVFVAPSGGSGAAVEGGDLDSPQALRFIADSLSPHGYRTFCGALRDAAAEIEQLREKVRLAKGKEPVG